MTSRNAILIILALTLWRIAALAFDRTDLFVDEAQYWFWSRHLDFGYYSKPPMIAWVLSLVTWLSGSSEIFWLRLPGPIIHAATAMVLMAASRRVAREDIAGWVGVAFATAPAVGLSSYLFSTDVVLLFFIAVGLWAYFGLTQKTSVALAIVMGVAFGGAFLSKYAVLFLVPGGLVALVLIPSARIGWRDFAIAVIAAVAVAFPNIWWNLTHDITTVRHTQDIAHWDSLGINIRHGLEFFLAQFAVVGPIIFFALLWAVWRMIRGQNSAEENMLVWLSMPVVALITLQALVAKAYANWAVTAYAAGTILAVWLLSRRWPRGLWVSLVINGLAVVLFPLAPIFAHDLHMPSGREMMERYLGRSEMSRSINASATKAGADVIVAENRDILADLFHTLRSIPVSIYARAPSGFPANYYEQEFALPAGETRDALYVTETPFTCALEEPKLLDSITPKHGFYRGRTILLYKTKPACLAAAR